MPSPHASVPVLPGAVGLSSLTVYADGAADGHAGGSAHIHLVCSEAYYVVAGRGVVQTLAPHGFRETALEAGAVVSFGPGTIHRLVNHGELRIVVLMQNAGLPEAGDAVLTLPPEHLASRTRYDAAAALPPAGALERSRSRRDLSIEGFTRLREAHAAQGPGALEPFYAAATELVRPRVEEWRRRWEAGAQQATADTARRLDALAAGDLGHLGDAAPFVQAEPRERGRLGMCGHLDTYAATAPDGGDGEGQGEKTVLRREGRRGKNRTFGGCERR